jgi:hypothetical protein
MSHRPHASAIRRDACLSPRGEYRYSLDRVWQEQGPRLVFLMLNPSTADAEVDDLTVTRCVGFAADAGFASLRIVNLFALRSTDPVVLVRVPDPIGPSCDQHISESCVGATVVCAWGASRMALPRGRAVLPNIANNSRITCLRLTQDGHPAHPSRLPANLRPTVWDWRTGPYGR